MLLCEALSVELPRWTDHADDVFQDMKSRDVTRASPVFYAMVCLSSPVLSCPLDEKLATLLTSAKQKHLLGAQGSEGEVRITMSFVSQPIRKHESYSRALELPSSTSGLSCGQTRVKKKDES